MAYAVDPERGQLVITSHGKRREIACGADPIGQRAVVNTDVDEVGETVGAEVRIEWAEREDGLWPFDAIDPLEDGSTWRPSLRERAFQLLRGFTLFNPHLSMSVTWFDRAWSVEATGSGWKKWKPNKPTSPHWYELQHFQRLIGAYISLDRERGTDRTVASFVNQFDGLTGSGKRKAVLEECGLSRVNLSELVTQNGFKATPVNRLLDAMQRHTNPIKPHRLGIVGKDHLLSRFVEMGCDSEQFKYAKKLDFEDGLPYVLETAFGWLGDEAEDQRKIVTGANWSAAIKNPFRAFGPTGEGLEAQLSELKAGAREPILFTLHLAHPRVQYTDRGKSAISMGEDA